jgi:hypothetical protein
MESEDSLLCPLDAILSQFKPVHILTYDFLEIYFNIILPFAPLSFK